MHRSHLWIDSASIPSVNKALNSSFTVIRTWSGWEVEWVRNREGSSSLTSWRCWGTCIFIEHQHWIQCYGAAVDTTTVQRLSKLLQSNRLCPCYHVISGPQSTVHTITSSEGGKERWRKRQTLMLTYRSQSHTILSTAHHTLRTLSYTQLSTSFYWPSIITCTVYKCQWWTRRLLHTVSKSENPTHSWSSVYPA